MDNCRERTYLKCIFLHITMISVWLSLQVHRVNTMECGTVNLARSLVISGTDALQGEWPFMAIVQKQSNFRCAGTIISNRHILTAAHCVLNKKTELSPNEVRVRLGTFNITNANEEGVIQRNVSDIFIHDDWDPYNTTFVGDIAILRLSENITFTDDIQPVCMPPVRSSNSIEGFVVGWSRTMGENSVYAGIQQKAFVRAVNESHCFRVSALQRYSSASTFCGGNGDGSPDQGDSGGGFFSASGSSWAQYGIVSAVYANGSGYVVPTAYHLYTNVTEFKKWIIETVNSTGGIVGVANVSWNITMNCRYDYTQSSNLARIYTIYTCLLYDIDIERKNVIAGSFTGQHFDRKTKLDVEGIHFVNGTMFFLPSDFGLFFENIKFLTVAQADPNAQSLGTTTVRRSDLGNLYNLMNVSFFRNNIETVNGDALWDLPELLSFELVDNKLKALSEETFMYNKKLVKVYLNSNQLTFLPANLFKNNLLLENVEVENNFIATIDEQLFETNSMLQGAYIGSNRLEMLPKHLFRNNVQLRAADFQNNRLTSIDEDLFATNVNLVGAFFSLNRIESLPKFLFRNNIRLYLVEFNNNSITAIDDNFFEKNKRLKSISFSSNNLEKLQRNLFSSNSLINVLDFFNNRLKVIDIDFTELQIVKIIDLSLNECVDAVYVKQTDLRRRNLERFQNLVMANCTVKENKTTK